LEIFTKVKPPTKQVPLLDYMSSRFTYRPRETWAGLIENGNVLLEGKPTTAETLVSAGDMIATTIVDPNPPDANYAYTIVYEDENLLAVNKPSNLRVHGRGRYIHANLIHHIRHVREVSYPESSLINRIDANTTGLVLLSKNQQTLIAMQKLFQIREIEKTYLAIVKGVPAETSGVVTQPIGQLPSADGVYRYGTSENAKKIKDAETHWKLVRPIGEGFSLVELSPKTGRTHQLRVHMAAIGHPLAGDAVYQLSDEDYMIWCDHPERFPELGFHRHALHCWKYNFVNPVDQRPIEISAPPSDFDRFSP
jgi:23S rRNA pseudouridine1911/1915/1917 synthase